MEKLIITRENFRKYIEEVALENGKDIESLHEIDKILPGIFKLSTKSMEVVFVDNRETECGTGELV